LSSAVATIPDAPATAAHHNAVASGALLPQAPDPARPILSNQGQPLKPRRSYSGKNRDICESIHVSTPLRSCAWSIDGATRR
jgi:hypothetical protein